MIREQLRPCIIAHHHYSLSILNQLQVGHILDLHNGKSNKQNNLTPRKPNYPINMCKRNQKPNLMYKVIFNNCWSTEAIPNINKSWQSTSCQALKIFQEEQDIIRDSAHASHEP